MYSSARTHERLAAAFPEILRKYSFERCALMLTVHCQCLCSSACLPESRQNVEDRTWWQCIPRDFFFGGGWSLVFQENTPRKISLTSLHSNKCLESVHVVKNFNVCIWRCASVFFCFWGGSVPRAPDVIPPSFLSEIQSLVHRRIYHPIIWIPR